MIHNIAWKDRTQTVSCYLPEDSLPEKAAVTELYQMTELEETLKKLAAVPGIFQGEPPGGPGLFRRGGLGVPAVGGRE